MTTPEISVDRLADMIANLEAHIQARAEEIAATRIAATQTAAKAYIAMVEKRAADQAQQDADLITELRRQVATAERFVAQARRRAIGQKAQAKAQARKEKSS